MVTQDHRSWWGGRRHGSRGDAEVDLDDDQVELTSVRARVDEERGDGNLSASRGDEELCPRADEDDESESVQAEGARLQANGEEQLGRGHEFASEGALAGPDWQARLGGLVFATTATRHSLPAVALFILFGGFLAPLPCVLRMTSGQLLGLMVLRMKSGRLGVGERVWRCCRLALLCFAVTLDVVISVLACTFLQSAIDALLREPTPSRPVNTYWAQVYAVFWIIAVLDVTLSLVAIVPLLRALHCACCPSWQPQRSAHGWALKLCFVRSGLMPHRHALRALKYLAPVCNASVICGCIFSGAALFVWMGLWGAWVPGQRCTMTTGIDGGECYAITGACDPLDPTECLLPFPSSFFLREDTTSFTGFRIRIPPGASIPLNGGGPEAFNLDSINVLDGFSTMAPILFRLGDGPFGARIDPNTLRPPSADAIPWGPGALETSTNARTSHTLLIDVETGELCPHWVERDVSEDEYPRGSLIILQPAKALRNKGHYVVAVRWFREEFSGRLLQPSPAFGEYLRGLGDSSRQGVFDDVIFRTLFEGMGWMRHEVQLAWDFRTGSWEGGPGRVEHMIRDSQERLETARTPPRFQIDDVVPDKCSEGKPAVHRGGNGREVWGSISVPSYLTSPGPGHDLLRVVSGGIPVANGDVEQVLFCAYIPCSVLDGARDHGALAARIIQYGHGFLGTRDESMWEMRGLAEETRSLVWAIDWGGLSRFDLVPLGKVVLSDLGKFPLVPAQLSQTFANGASSLWYLRTLLRLDPAFSLTQGSGASGSESTLGQGRASNVPLLAADTPIMYFGVSLGGVLGAGYTLSSPHISRSILDVGGSPFALILTRSTDFAAFQQLLATQVTRPTHRRIAYSLLQTVWDPAESAGWLSGAAERSRRTGKAFLLQTARGDSQVPGVAAAVMARSLGAVTVVPALGRVYGLAEKPRGWSFNLSSLQQPSPLSPLPSSSEGHQPFFTALFQEFEYPDVFPEPVSNVPAAPSTNTHFKVRRDPMAHKQVVAFINGVVRGVGEREDQGGS